MSSTNPSPQRQPVADATSTDTTPSQPLLPGDSAVTKAEKLERHGANSDRNDVEESPAKRPRLDQPVPQGGAEPPANSDRNRAVAPIKPEYLIEIKGTRIGRAARQVDDDAAESAGHRSQEGKAQGSKRERGLRGQNKNREFGSSRDALQLCSSRVTSPEFSPSECRFGEKCKYEHDLRKYLKEGKREDLQTLEGLCPIWDKRGTCNLGWKCRFAGSHSEERETEDGRKELVLKEDPERIAAYQEAGNSEELGIVNVVSAKDKINLSKRITKTPKSDKYIQWLNATMDEERKQEGERKNNKDSESKEEKLDNNALYTDPPLRPSEKRRLYYGPETPMLAPLTTQGNLPFRRLCVELGAQITWSEMAMGLPIIQGERGEWALMKAHESEVTPPKFESKGDVVTGYDNSRDLKFGAQVAANKPWLASKTAEVLSMLCPRLRAIDLNCGCPIDLVFRQGAGSALLDSPGRLEKCLRSMNTVSGEIPITVKIRMGTRDNEPTARKLVTKLIDGDSRTGEGPSGVAAITLHGRSRQQRYTRQADWEYISDCAAMISRLKQERAERMDTSAEGDARDQPGGGKVYFVGNGDCYSHIDYYNHIENAKVDSIMIGRGAIIKPWLFEEIEKGQYLDKSATERLAYIEKFAKYGLEAWGSDEIGVGNTRRFLLEWLSFGCRYVPLGLLEHLPPHLNDRPPAYRGRNDLETLLASDDYRDWIKISEMFLGPAHPNFKFVPKHKSNSYEIEAEG